MESPASFKGPQRRTRGNNPSQQSPPKALEKEVKVQQC